MGPPMTISATPNEYDPPLPQALIASRRLCPACGALVVQAFCPQDGSGTISLVPAPSSAWQVQPGQILAGKYRIVRELGHGGHGVVYRAEHLFGLGSVALKLLRNDEPDVAEMRRFFREAQVLGRLQGVHTARVYDVGQTEQGSIYLAMELVEGITLEARLRELQAQQQVLGEQEATQIGEAILLGLQEIHDLGLVHRDIKPSNIALGGGQRNGTSGIKILDFGLARVMGSSLTPSSRALGTPQYMSPEQCSGLGVDGRADLYALGVLLYRAVVGSAPFRDPNPLTNMWSHVHAPVPDLAAAAPLPLSPRFCSVVLRALAKNPSQRFASADEMRLALTGAVSAYIASAADRAPSPAERATWSALEPGDSTASARALASVTPARTGQNQVVSVDGDLAQPATPQAAIGSIGPLAAVATLAATVLVVTLAARPAHEQAPAVVSASGISVEIPGSPGSMAGLRQRPAPPAVAPTAVAGSAAGPALNAAPAPVRAEPRRGALAARVKTSDWRLKYVPDERDSAARPPQAGH